MSDPAVGLSILHVIVRVAPTNSQYNEHCLPVLDERHVTVCSLFPAVDVTPPPSLTLFEGDGTTRGCMRALRRALDFGPYDIVHVHAPSSGVLTLAAYFLTRRERRGLVFTVHNSWHNFRRRNRMFLRLILALFPLVVVCGRAAYESIPDNLRRRYGRKLEVVPNGVDVDRIEASLSAAEDRRDAGRKEAGGTVVSVARLIPLKDPATLLEAFVRAHRSFDRLVLVGDGPLRGELESAVHELGLQPSVQFTGVVERDEVFRILDRADVFVSTSGGEGLPVAMLEAMACGCPVVVSDIPPHREIAERTPGIPLVPVGDGPGFARSLARMLALSESDRQALGQRLRRCVAEHFSVRTMNDAYGEVYMKVINQDASGEPRSLHPAGPADDGVDPPLMTKLRRRLGLVLTLTMLGALGGLVYAQLQTPLYKGETTMWVGTGIGVAADDEALRASATIATTYADLARREPVLGPVAAQGFADSWRELQDHVHSQTGDKNPRLVQISVYGKTAGEAERLARAVLAQLVLVTSEGATTPQQEFLGDQLGGLQSAITETARALQRTKLRAEAVPSRERSLVLRDRADELRSTLVDLQANYTDIRDQLRNSDVGRVTTIDDPWVSRSPLRPTPVALVIAGAAAGLALATSWVHLFDRSGVPRGPVHAAGRPTGPGRGREAESWAEPEPPIDIQPTRTKGTGK